MVTNVWLAFIRYKFNYNVATVILMESLFLKLSNTYINYTDSYNRNPTPPAIGCDHFLLLHKHCAGLSETKKNNNKVTAKALKTSLISINNYKKINSTTIKSLDHLHKNYKLVEQNT